MLQLLSRLDIGYKRGIAKKLCQSCYLLVQSGQPFVLDIFALFYAAFTIILWSKCMSMSEEEVGNSHGYDVALCGNTVRNVVLGLWLATAVLSSEDGKNKLGFKPRFRFREFPGFSAVLYFPFSSFCKKFSGLFMVNSI